MLFTVLVCATDSSARSTHEDRVHSQPALILCSTVSYARAKTEIAALRPKVVWLEVSERSGEGMRLFKELSAEFDCAFVVSGATLDKAMIERFYEAGASAVIDSEDWFAGAKAAAEKMEQTWKKAGYEPQNSAPLPTREALLLKAKEAPATAVAVEAFWDGDTYGWFVVLTIIFLESTSGGRYGEFDIAVMRSPGGDFRLFIGDVPPWPEAKLASEVGEELSRQLGIPFYFASPDQPKDCPRWWECC